MTEHTPIPWRVDGEGARALIRGADITIVALRHRLSGKLHENNFKLIVRAVNSHHDMLALLEELIDIEGPMPGTAAWAEKARAAIRRAKGEG